MSSRFADGCIVTEIGSSENESMMPKRSSYIWNVMREKATSTRFSFPACHLILARHSSNLTYSVRRCAHLWSLWLRSRSRKGHVSSERSTKNPAAYAYNKEQLPIPYVSREHSCIHISITLYRIQLYKTVTCTEEVDNTRTL